MRWRWLFLPAIWVLGTTPFVGLTISLILGFLLIVLIVIPLEYFAMNRRQHDDPDHDLLANSYKYDR